MKTLGDHRGSPESRLTLYSAVKKELCIELIEGFEKRYPDIETEVRSGISVALHERYLAEVAAGKPEADVIWSSGMDLQMGLVLSRHAMPYRSSERHALLDSTVYRDTAYATTVEPLLTVVNRQYFDTKVRAGSVAELTAAFASNPGHFRGRVACSDITRNGVGFLALLHESLHEADFDAFMRALAACKPNTFGTNPELVADVASGRAVLACHVLASFALPAVRSNPALAIAATDAPSLAVSRVAFIPASAPHPNAAKCFLDHLLSREGQRQLGEAQLFPIRRDASGGTVDDRTVEPIRIDQGCPDLLDQRRRDDILLRWREAVGMRSDMAEAPTAGR